jgi:uncharacterized membrane protein YdjX (TVP38/TMEM64 family)
MRQILADAEYRVERIKEMKQYSPFAEILRAIDDLSHGRRSPRSDARPLAGDGRMPEALRRRHGDLGYSPGVFDTVPPRQESARARIVRRLLSPWCRFGLLVAVLGAAAAVVLVCQPQHLLSGAWPAHAGGFLAAVLFALLYGLCAAAFAPRPLLNAAAGALLGTATGLGAAIGGTVLAASIAFGLGRALGQGALRPLVRGRWLTAADGLMSRYGFRSMMAIRLFPGVPFAAANYAAAVSRMPWPSFVVATALGSVPNTAAYVVAGSTAASPTSPAFLVSTGFIALSAAAAGVIGWRKRHQLRAAARAHGGSAAARRGPRDS